MYAELSWCGGMKFEAQTETGHKILMDSLPKYGGENAGPCPMELVLVAEAGCTAMDVIAILKKMKQNVKDFKIKIEAERKIEHPRVFTDIKLIYILKGENLDPQKVKKAVELSQEKYCSVGAMLKKTAKIDYEIKIE